MKNTFIKVILMYVIVDVVNLIKYSDCVENYANLEKTEHELHMQKDLLIS